MTTQPFQSIDHRQPLVAVQSALARRAKGCDDGLVGFVAPGIVAVGTGPDPQRLLRHMGCSGPEFRCWWDRRLDRCLSLFSFHHLPPARRGVQW